MSKPLEEFYEHGISKRTGMPWYTGNCKRCYLKHSPNYGKPNLGKYNKGNIPWNKKEVLGRQSIELKIWREKIKKRDNYKCVKCFSRKRLHAHHIKDWHNFPNLRFDMSNGITLCTSCHARLHGKEKCNLLKNGEPWLKGKKMSIELRKKLSDVHKGKIPWNKGLRGTGKVSGDLA